MGAPIPQNALSAAASNWHLIFANEATRDVVDRKCGGAGAARVELNQGLARERVWVARELYATSNRRNLREYRTQNNVKLSRSTAMEPIRSMLRDDQIANAIRIEIVR